MDLWRAAAGEHAGLGWSRAGGAAPHAGTAASGSEAWLHWQCTSRPLAAHAKEDALPT